MRVGLSWVCFSTNTRVGSLFCCLAGCVWQQIWERPMGGFRNILMGRPTGHLIQRMFVKICNCFLLIRLSHISLNVVSLIFSCLHTFILTMCSFVLQYLNYYYTSLVKFSNPWLWGITIHAINTFFSSV